MSVPTIAPYFPFRRIKIIKQNVTPEAGAAHTLLYAENLSGFLQLIRRRTNYKNVAYYGRSIESLTKEELLEAFLELAMMVKACPFNGECMRLFDTSDIRKGKDF